MTVHPVTIEAALGNGFSGVQLIGVPQEYARDARERIRAALESVGCPLPARRLVVSFRPVEVLRNFRSGLEHLDLPCAIAILAALADQSSVPQKLRSQLSSLAAAIRDDEHLFAGQLTLAGELLPPQQSLPFELIALGQSSRTPLFWSNIELQHVRRRSQQSFVRVKTLRECTERLIACDTINQQADVFTETPAMTTPLSQTPRGISDNNDGAAHFFDKFVHTPVLAVTLALACAGRHHILLAGSPGCGKTFALRHFKHLLPPLNSRQQLEVALIHQKDIDATAERPYRHPHHSASAAALLGGSLLQPGEVSLAHHGVLFLDELSEFPRPALEALREPLDEKKITLSRSRGRVELPADFLLTAATNPCACGYFFSKQQSCRCVGNSAIKYQQKLSGPLLERFPILLLMDHLQPHNGAGVHTSTAALCQFAEEWAERFQDDPKHWNDHFIRVRDTSWTCQTDRKHSPLAKELVEIVKSRAERQQKSARVQSLLGAVTMTACELFPDIVKSWDADKFAQAIEQLRDLEASLRQGVSLMTPFTAEHILKESNRRNDTL
jgi:magnesium chelatase family protein